ncbi:hypothetical protein JDV02_009628 [Purpureocillium takamizusanense]|uniref:Amidohydrolase-related domain-containing protein n=1 Tax=Purpureocillium takamizusanense TaxID=2060973 RepID=A0A9Q8QSB3_9HYPO|nr:uncharacterized protein JDV02_009628 [Purpureocillium takamizusanense]UNI23834.1 hypothetical protein JDV02_009628 [Purpureocillium takamizusanense]
MATTLLKGGTVLMHGEDDKVTPALVDILIQGGRIANIGSNLSPEAGCDVVDCASKIISPGFIDTHHHMWEAPLKGLFGDCAFVPYMAIMYTASRSLEAEDFFWANLATGMELLDAGTTTVLDHAHAQWSPEHSKQSIAGILSAGIRSIYAPAPTLQLDSEKPKANFVLGGALPEWFMETFELLAASQSIREADSRLKLGFGFDIYYLPKETIQEIFQRVKSLGAQIITSHYIRPHGEKSYSVAAQLHSYGLLDDKIVLSHAGGATAEDVKLISEANAYVAVTPSSESAMAVGPPVAFREGDLNMDKNCALGIDCAAFGSGSLVQEMRLGLQSARRLDSMAHHAHGTLPKGVFHTTHEAFNMATIHGARALCMEEDIGSIQIGKKADLVVFDALSPSMAGAAQQDPIMAIVLHSNVGDVDAVMVDGQFRKRDGKLLPARETVWTDNTTRNFVETGKTLSWREIACSLLQIQERFVGRLKDYDLDHIATSLSSLFHFPE